MGKKAKTKTKTKNQTTTSPSPLGCIIPNALYLAPVSATGNPDVLKREGITHIMSIGKNPVARIDGITYHKFGLLDDEDTDLLPVVDKICEVLDGIIPPQRPSSGVEGTEAGRADEEDAQKPEEIEEATKAEDILADSISEERQTTGTGQSRARVLIHCSAGISRSPAVVAGYLMKSRGMTLRDSLGLLVNAREVVSPNVGFLRQLCELERQVFGLVEGEKGTFDKDSLKGGGKLRKALGI